MSLKDLTEATVRGALEEYERLFSRLDVDGIVAGFADDVRVRYSNYEPFTGKERLKTFFTRRFASMKDYRGGETNGRSSPAMHCSVVHR
jgi:ketosteroid isomerase-like protein